MENDKDIIIANNARKVLEIVKSYENRKLDKKGKQNNGTNNK